VGRKRSTKPKSKRSSRKKLRFKNSWGYLNNNKSAQRYCRLKRVRTSRGKKVGMTQNRFLLILGGGIGKKNNADSVGVNED